MRKRQFLSTVVGLAAGSLIAPAKAAVAPVTAGQTILTLLGDIHRSNRGPVNVVKDQYLHKLGLHFERGFTFSLDELEQLPQVAIRPTVEYDDQVHTFSGPRLADVLAVAEIHKTPTTRIILHGIDGYAPEMAYSQSVLHNYILATRMDNELLSIGGLGPLFAIYDADRMAEMAQLPLAQRFQKCPWGLFCIEVLN